MSVGHFLGNHLYLASAPSTNFQKLKDVGAEMKDVQSNERKRETVIQQRNYEKPREARNPTYALSKGPTGKARSYGTDGPSTGGLSLIS